MPSNVTIQVFLEAVGNAPPPAEGAINFTYVLDSGSSDKWVHVKDKGDIYVGNADAKNTSLVFVLKTKTLSWNGQTYYPTFKPNVARPDGAAEMIYISTDTTKSPSTRWPPTDKRFDEFVVPSDTANPGRDALQVKFNRDLGNDDVFQYSVAVNISDSQNNFVATVRDDPQIKDRGVPSAPNHYEWLAAGLGLITGMLVTYLIMKRRMQTGSQPGLN